jgi:ferritin-like metal-binding protein YciE
MATNPKIDTNDPAQAETGRAMVLQYLQEAHATEQALVTNLRAHISMTPRGSYRDLLERHLAETQQHERAVARRIREVGSDGGILAAAYGLATTIVGQALVLTKGPLDLLRGGTEGEEKLLKNARDEVVTEALEIAIYDALEELALAVGDEPTAKLAARHRGQEERMLEQLRRLIPRLSHAVVQARAGGQPSSEWDTTGAADAARSAGRGAKRTASRTQRKAGSTARSAASSASSSARRATSSRSSSSSRRSGGRKAEAPLTDYDKLTASQAVSKLTDLTQDQLAQVIAYERANRKRTTVIDRAQSLQENEPFPGYDDLTARDVAQRVRDADEATARRVREYEGRHQRRVEVLESAQRQLSGSSSSGSSS